MAEPVSFTDEKKGDPLREPPIRYLGYANEIGESFRSQIHVNYVRATYGLATAYVIADAIHRGGQAAKKPWPSQDVRQTKILWEVFDTLVWQGLASVIIPGFTINRICACSNFVLTKTLRMPAHVRKWTVTLIGLSSIPFIISPIDNAVDHFMEATFRKYYKYEGPVLK
ncbi:mitochondrial fission process protein 1-like [Dreissena polymorpha]|uniref:Mitochondrial fission process protein 1 n=1 Tax=Dreissena polymorpha TaxID=45954 RepID=A0A9D4M832_DREPO|nr:mitochondrial fission process protein 1-like [Dreissena polymorpha]KAH3870792.1 hypothetical protein DPMN_033982 [Dreissena polymorpha]